MKKRIFLIVIDSLGIGAMPDAAQFSDEGSNTLGAIRDRAAFRCPTLSALGLFHIDGVGGAKGEARGAYARMSERSAGKDTTVGHWEIAGCVTERPLPTYPNGFPPSVIKQLRDAFGRDILCNLPYSGTEVIRDFGEEHLRTGALIVYTSADSVLQIAAHEDIVPTEELYGYCRLARRIMVGEHGVGRIIARPFTGTHPFTRTARRHDFSLPPIKETALDRLASNGYDVIGVGKIGDIFAGRGVTESYPTEGNAHGLRVTEAQLSRDFEGLCFVNLVDFDMKYGHRNDPDGYAAAMTELDTALSGMLPRLREGDLLLITADHGCDPSTPSTDHSREYTPLLIYGDGVRAATNLGTRQSFADIGATVLAYFGLDRSGLDGESFLEAIF